MSCLVCQFKRQVAKRGASLRQAVETREMAPRVKAARREFVKKLSLKIIHSSLKNRRLLSFVGTFFVT